MTMPTNVPSRDRRSGEIQTAYDCVPNIGPRGRRWRALLAGVGLLAGVAGTIALMVRRPEPIELRLLLGVPFLIASLAYFQVREKT